jgi:hypothetical protein
LSEGVAAWLTFERHSGREGLFSEKYLALPVAQILANHFGGNVEAEHNHPVLSDLGRRGRPPQLDFIVRNSSQVSLVVESKWIGASSVKVEDVVWDCVRLELAANHYTCDSLFLLAGEKEKVYKALESNPFNPKTSRGNPSPILSLNGNGRLSVNIQSPKKAFGPKLHDYLKNYSEIMFPRSFVCGYGSQVNKHALSNDFIAAVWHIKPEINKRYTFSAGS